MPYTIFRYPQTQSKSLQAWNAADEYILNYIKEKDIKIKKPLLFNDRFGYLSINLHYTSPYVTIDYKSQEKAISYNISKNCITDEFHFCSPLDVGKTETDCVIIKIPKSLEHFELYLQEASKAISENGIVLCGFMTKYFTTQILSVAEIYFENVSQSLAWKKSRLLILKNPKKKPSPTRIKKIPFGDSELQQYYGVFSSDRIDIGSRFFMDVLNVEVHENKILDLASGNGVLALFAHQQNPDAKIHLIDDSYVAVKSSKLNAVDGNFHFHFNDSLEDLKAGYFDLIISNPPFHFGHETNIEISLNLFEQAKKCLAPKGRFCIVANKHLNYSTHLSKLFPRVETIASNNKFEVITCEK